MESRDSKLFTTRTNPHSTMSQLQEPQCFNENTLLRRQSDWPNYCWETHQRTRYFCGSDIDAFWELDNLYDEGEILPVSLSRLKLLRWHWQTLATVRWRTIITQSLLQTRHLQLVLTHLAKVPRSRHSLFTITSAMHSAECRLPVLAHSDNQTSPTSKPRISWDLTAKSSRLSFHPLVIITILRVDFRGNRIVLEDNQYDLDIHAFLWSQTRSTRRAAKDTTLVFGKSVMEWGIYSRWSPCEIRFGG